MLLILWLILGVVVLTVLITKKVKIADIESSVLRRAALVAVLVVVAPAYVALCAADHFLRWSDPDDFPDLTAKKAFNGFLQDIGPSLLEDLKETWNGR